MDNATMRHRNSVTALGLTMNTTFIPQSQSRNAKGKYSSINHLFTIARKGRKQLIHGPYTQWIGHLVWRPKPRNSNNRRGMESIEREACEKGHARWGSTRIFAPAPTLKDILYSLLMDRSSVDNVRTVGEFIKEFGYEDIDEGLKAFIFCQDIANQLNRMFSEQELERLEELYQDY